MVSDEHGNQTRQCSECGATNWSLDHDYRKLVCSECGYQPRDAKEQNIRENLQEGDWANETIR